MATIIGSTNSPEWSFKYDAYEINTNIEENTSVLRVDIWLGRTRSRAPIGGTWSGYAQIYRDTPEAYQEPISGGITYPTYVDGGGWLYLTTKDFLIHHNADGSRSVRVTVEIAQTQFTPSYCVADAVITLSTIPRATKCPALTGNIKSSYDLILQPASNTFTHSLRVHFGGINKYVQSDGTLGDSEYRFSTRQPLFTLPKEFYSQFDGPSGEGSLYLKTYQNNTAIGSEQRGRLVATCNQALVTPMATATVIDVNESSLGVTHNENHIIKNVSTARITPTIQISDPDDTRATLTKKAVNDIVFTTDYVDVMNASDKTFTLSLQNSRRYSANISVSANGNLIDYQPLTFNLVRVYRPEPTTGEVKVEYNGNYFDNNFEIDNANYDGTIFTVNNSLQIQWQYREHNSEEWIIGGNLSPNINHEKNTYQNDESLGMMFDYTKQYDFIFFYTDLFKTDSLQTSVSRGIPVWWWDSKVFHVEDTLQVNNKIYLGENELTTDIHYSTEEIVVGTWFGKSLYQRVFELGVLDNMTHPNDSGMLYTYFSDANYNNAISCELMIVSPYDNNRTITERNSVNSPVLTSWAETINGQLQIIVDRKSNLHYAEWIGYATVRYTKIESPETQGETDTENEINEE